MQRQLLFALLCGATLLMSACGQDVKSGGQYVGQRCYVTSDCAPNLVCSGRVCTPIGGVDGERQDMSPDSTGDMDPDIIVMPDAEPDIIILPDMNPIDMMPPVCREGQRSCLGERSYQECVRQGDSTTFVRRTCPDESVCEMGRCVDLCVDRDQDGFFANCEPLDCNDSRRTINPAAPEVCGNNRDDNCDGRRDEGCMMNNCCAGGCGPQEFCSACQCEAFDPNICTRQDQPCNNPDSFDNGFFCGDITGDGINRCIGVCQLNAIDPDSTCPDPNSVCTFEANDMGQGICLTTCQLGQGCGGGLGCVPYDNAINDGVCVPTNPNNPIGTNCDPQRFFDCEEGAICVQDQRGGGQCVEACRPFVGSNVSDCSMGSYCQVASDSIGTCQPDNGRSEGDNCRPFGSSCGEDAVGCYPFDGGGQTCTRLCRRSENDADCPNGICTAFDPNSDIGYCGALPP